MSVRPKLDRGGFVKVSCRFLTMAGDRCVPLYDSSIRCGQRELSLQRESPVKLVTDKSVDVVVVAAGQPAPPDRQYDAGSAEAHRVAEVRPRLSDEQAR